MKRARQLIASVLYLTLMMSFGLADAQGKKESKKTEGPKYDFAGFPLRTTRLIVGLASARSFLSFIF